MKKQKILKIGKIIAFIALIIMIVAEAWLCDDAYISFRVVKNFVNGYGLRWNIIERVQVFTNPLMVLMLIPFYYITNEIYYTSIIFSIIASSLAIYLLMFKISKNDLISILIAIFLISSKSFISFTTSGLENCLTFLLLAIFYYLFFKKEIYLKKDILLLSFVSSLILLNRMDSILLVIPSLIYVFLKRDKDVTVFKFLIYFAIGMIPFILWESFALVYYGFLLPNTYYAKVTAGFSKLEYLYNGLVYMVAVLLLDPATTIIIFMCLFLVYMKSSRKETCLVIGTILSIVYVVYVGGDFMLGRFLTPGLFVTLIGFSKLKPEHFNIKLFKFVLALSLIVYIGFYVNYINDETMSIYHEKAGVADEREFYFEHTSLFFSEHINQKDVYTTFEERKYAENIYIAGNIGFLGFFAKDNDTIIDYYALANPFLSRVPVLYDKFYRIGHNSRNIDSGYFETVRKNENLIQDENLKEFYEVIKTITQDEIFSKKRIKTIIKYHLGKYDYLIEDYLKKQKA